MSERTGLRWEPWPVETGASRALAPTGQSYIARPHGDGYALYYGGQFVKRCTTAAE